MNNDQKRLKELYERREQLVEQLAKVDELIRKDLRSIILTKPVVLSIDEGRTH